MKNLSLLMAINGKSLLSLLIAIGEEGFFNICVIAIIISLFVRFFCDILAPYLSAKIPIWADKYKEEEKKFTLEKFTPDITAVKVEEEQDKENDINENLPFFKKIGEDLNCIYAYETHTKVVYMLFSPYEVKFRNTGREDSGFTPLFRADGTCICYNEETELIEW